MKKSELRKLIKEEVHKKKISDQIGKFLNTLKDSKGKKVRFQIGDIDKGFTIHIYGDWQ